MWNPDSEPWRVSGGGDRWWVEKPRHGHTLDGKSGRIRLFRTQAGAIRACDVANAERHKRISK
jgi:hypothetical protein